MASAFWLTAVVEDVPAMSLIHPPDRESMVAPPLTARAWFPAPAEPVELTLRLVLPVAPADKFTAVPDAVVRVEFVADRKLNSPEDTRLTSAPFSWTPPVPVFVRSIPPFAPVERLKDPKADDVPLLKLIVEATGVEPEAMMSTPDVLIVSAVKPPFRLVAPRERPPAPLFEIVSAPLVPAPRVILAKAPVVPELKFNTEVVGTVPYPIFTYPEVVRLPDVSYCAIVLAVPFVLEFTDSATGVEKLKVVPEGFRPAPMLRPFADDNPRFARAVGMSLKSNKLFPRLRKVL